MAAIWNDDSRDVFDRHTERMRLFGRSHSPVREGEQQRADAILSHAILLSGGARVRLSGTGWSNLISIWKVTLRRFSRS